MFLHRRKGAIRRAAALHSTGCSGRCAALKSEQGLRQHGQVYLPFFKIILRLHARIDLPQKKGGERERGHHIGCIRSSPAQLRARQGHSRHSCSQLRGASLKAEEMAAA